MEPAESNDATRELAAALRRDRELITTRWLERIAARVSLEPERIFPSDELLDHVPILIDGVADFIENPADDIAADAPVLAKGMELGSLRFQQGFDASEILKEYEMLGGILYHYALTRPLPVPLAPTDVFQLGHRLFRAISVLSQVTTAHYLRMLAERVSEREERLRRFNRMLTHELKNRVGAVLGAGELLQEDWLPAAERKRFTSMVTENAQAIQKVLENLISLTRLDGERRRQRNIMLPEAVAEVTRQLRDLARMRGVQVRVPEPLPNIEVHAAAVELCLSNYLSNAIKYADMSRADRQVAILAHTEADASRLIVRVIDNGLGVPASLRPQLFERFFRAHHEAGVEGTGLGLSLVRETAQSFGGDAWAEFDQPEGSCFAFSLPYRRLSDAAGAVRATAAAE